MDNKAIHDLLLAVKPADAVHDTDTCNFCQESTNGSEPVVATAGGANNVSELTQADLDKAVKEAVAPLTEELSELRKFKVEIESSEAAQATQAKIEAAEAQATELQEKLDAENIKATEAQTNYDNLVAYLEATAAETEAEAKKAQVREERAEAVKELKIFSDEHVEENADRYAEMDEESFAAAVEDWKVIKASKTSSKKEADEELPKTTVFTATRDDDDSPKSNLSVIRLRNEGIDLRKIR